MKPLAVDPIAALAPLVEPGPLDSGGPSAGTPFEAHLRKAVDLAPAGSAAAAPALEEPTGADDHPPEEDATHRDAERQAADAEETIERLAAIESDLPEPVVAELPVVSLPRVIEEPAGDMPARAVNADAPMEPSVSQGDPLAAGPEQGALPAAPPRPAWAISHPTVPSALRQAAPSTGQPPAPAVAIAAESAAAASGTLVAAASIAAPTVAAAEIVATEPAPPRIPVADAASRQTGDEAAAGDEARPAAIHAAAPETGLPEQPARGAGERPAADGANRRAGSRRRDDREPPAPHETRRGTAPSAFGLPAPARISTAAPAAPPLGGAQETQSTSDVSEGVMARDAAAPVEPMPIQTGPAWQAVEPGSPRGDAVPSRGDPVPPLVRRLETVVGPRAGRGESGEGLSPADRVRFVQRVARAFEMAADRGGPLRLRLSPPELGALRLEVQLRDGALQARIEAETPEARGLLLEQLPALRERLAQQQVRLERFEVDLRGEGSDGSPQAFDQGPRDEAREGRRPAPRAMPPVEILAAPRAGADIRAATGRLDVIV